MTQNRVWKQFRRNRGALVGAVLATAVAVVSLIGPPFAPRDPDEIFEEGLRDDGTPRQPDDRFLLGTDHLGRDELSRLLHGGAASMTVAMSATAIAVTLGLCVGLISGFFGGAIDSVTMRVIDLILSLPFLLVAIAINRVVQDPALWTLAVLLGALSWSSLARVTRSKTQQVRQLEYVQAARALGLSNLRVVLRHVLPNVLGPAIVIGTTMIANMIIVESAMSLFGAWR